jgi:hypothetical protein
MALILKDRVKETTAVTSTGTATLLGAVAGYQSFSAIGTGNTCYYTIAAQAGTEWEVGIGTYTSPDQLSRDTVLSSSNSGSLVNFSVGTKDVFVTQPSSKAVYTDASNIVNTSGNGANTVTFTNVNTANLVANSATLQFGTVDHVPSDGLDIANKAYVDTTTVGLTIHQAVVVARLNTNYSATYANGGTTPTWNTITANSILDTGGAAHSLSDNAIIAFGNVGSSNLTAGFGYFVKTVNSTAITVSTLLDGPNVSTLTNGTSLGITSRANSGVGATLTATANGAFVQDGVTVALNGRVLFNGQTNAFENGIYDLTTTGNATAQAVLTRSANENTYSPRSSTGLGQGDYFYITSGATNGGKSFVLATPGTLVFGTTNLTFDQFSATPVYSAGTGLTLTDTTFSLVTPVATTNGGTGLTSFTANAIPYASNTSALATGSALTFDGTNLSTTGQVISTKTGSATTGAGQVYLNGATSNRIDWAAVGTGAPAFTTRSDGTKLLLYPSISGSLTDYAIGIDAATMWSSVPENNASFKFKWYGATTEIANLTGTGAFTAASFTGNGVALTAINASNISSGTIDNARTTGNTANSASTIVLRDASGNFGANTISGAFSGDGTALTAINASNLSSGTVANARTTAASANGAATIVLRDSSGSFSAGDITAVSISGNGVALTAINASNIATGTIANARTTAATANGASTIVLRGSSGEFSAGTITGTFSGDGSAVSAINASNISSGTVATARLASGTANSSTYLRGDQTWSTISAGITITNDTTTNASYFPIFTSVNTGTISAANVSSSELIFNPGTNALTAPNILASNGLFVNNMTVAGSFSVPAGYSASSVGPVTVGSGATVTLPSGSRWVVL